VVGRVIALLPVVVLTAIRTLSPQYLDVFNSTSGQLVLGACALSMVLGYGAMRWMSRLPIDERVLGLVMPLAKFLPYACLGLLAIGLFGFPVAQACGHRTQNLAHDALDLLAAHREFATTLTHPSARAGSGSAIR